MYFFNRLSSLELTKLRVMKFQVQPTVLHSTLVEGKKLSYKFYVLTCLAPTGPDGPRIGPNWPELARIGLNGLEIGPKWPGLAQIDPKWTQFAPDWPPLALIGKKILFEAIFIQKVYLKFNFLAFLDFRKL